MSTSSVQPPYEIFTDIDGQPLEDGYIWLGTAGLPAIANPITAYWDAALTASITQPIRTIGGYPMNAGVPARIYVAVSDYSISVQNKNGSSIYSSLNATERYSSALVTFLQAGANAVVRTAQSKMRDIVSVKDFGAVSDCTGVGVGTDVIPAIQAAVAYAVTLSAGATIVLPPGRYRAATSAVLNLNGKYFITFDFQGVITPDATAMTVLTIENGFNFRINASIFDGGIFLGPLHPTPYGPCDYGTTRDAAAAGGQEMFLIRGVYNYDVNLRASEYAGRLLRIDGRSNASHPQTGAIKGSIKTERDYGLSGARVAQSIWAQTDPAAPNLGNWGRLDSLVEDFTYWGPVFKRLNDIEIATIDAAYQISGPTFLGCQVVLGNTWWIGDIDNAAGTGYHLKFDESDGYYSNQIKVKFAQFLNSKPGLVLNGAKDFYFYINHVYVNNTGGGPPNAAELTNCSYGTVKIDTSGNLQRAALIDGASTDAIRISVSTSNTTGFTEDIIKINSNVVGVVNIDESWCYVSTSAKSCLSVGGSARVFVSNSTFTGDAGNLFDFSANNLVRIYGGLLSNVPTLYASNPALSVIGTEYVGSVDINNFYGTIRTNSGGNSGGAGGDIDFGIATVGQRTLLPMAKIKGSLANATATELQGNILFQIRPNGVSPQSLVTGASIENTTTDGDTFIVTSARVSGASVTKRVKFGAAGTGPGGVGRAMYIDN